VELKSLLKGRDAQETSEFQIRNDAIKPLAPHNSEIHVHHRRNLAHHRLDRLFAAYWMKPGLPDCSVRGGPLIGGDVTTIELIHLVEPASARA